MTRTRVALAAAALHHACFAGLALSGALLVATEAKAKAETGAQADGFTPVGSYGAYRLDGVRDGMHEGARVRFVDMTLHNRSTETTFPETIQAIWWQGANYGGKVDARFRDLKRFGMYDFIKPGQQVAVTYIMPVRSDIDGIRADYMKAPKGSQERRWTWDELIGGGPGTLYHKGRPVGVPAAVAPAATAQSSSAQPTARTDASPLAAAPNASKPTPKLDPAKALEQVGKAHQNLGGLKGLLGSKAGKLPF